MTAPPLPLPAMLRAHRPPPHPTLDPDGHTPQGEAAVILRQDRAPQDQLDLTDRQETRVTSDDRTLAREIRYRREQTRRDWHRVGQELAPGVMRTLVALVGIVVLAVLYVTLFIALQRLLPTLTVQEDMWIAGAAVTAGLGGSGLRVAGQALAARYGRGRGGEAAPP